MPISPTGKSVQSREVSQPPSAEAAAVRPAPPDQGRDVPRQPGGEQLFRPTTLERSLIRRLLKESGDSSIAIAAGQEDFCIGSPAEVAHTIRVRTRPALWRLLRDAGYWFFEGYARGDIELNGDLLSLLNAIKRKVSLEPEPPRSLSTWLRTRRRRRRGKARQGNVARHYDLGNDFYKLWLDEQLLYTCAYFPDDSTSLEAAQVAKMDLVCRKLRLKPGEMVFEAGCGWGALALHMARRCGVRVRAFNLSKEQLAYARERAEQERLTAQVEFVEGDWSDITGRCDAFVSVGMLEHVGPENFRNLGRIISQTLTPTGRGLIHSIGQNTIEPMNQWIEDRIFPGAQPPTLQQMLDVFWPYNLAVLDIENLRPHYAETLRHWLLRFEQSADVVEKMFDAAFVRAWRIYLASSQSAFEVGSLQLYQILFARVGSNILPATRADIYRET